jgi:hypothetical protein
MPVTLTWEDDAGATVSAVFDVDLQETHEGTNIITEHPVEDGADIADHIRPQLQRFTVEGFVSDTPLLSNPDVVNKTTFVALELQIPDQPLKFGVSNAITAGIGAIGDALFPPKPLKVTMLTFDNFESRVRAARDVLETARTTARLIRILTSITEYENMVIEQVVITRSPEDGSGAHFTITLKQIEKVSSDITVAPEPAEISGSTKKAAGSKNAKDDEAKIDGLKKSILARAADGLGGFFDDGFGGL